ncbi:hypothetical protein P9G44_18420 [Bacillus paralicheniformis]|uniref:hypothetical protein n=1 Tax=Bacillus TaxID=1386 RepID=UPI00040D4E46|nr:MULTISPECIES: hypothetical protein [Bacillus]MEC2212655.1 hypothetical protein [Bacillus paralicheniformis]
MNEEQQVEKIDIVPYVREQLGAANYENLILKAQLDSAHQTIQELQGKIQELEDKLISQKPKK